MTKEQHHPRGRNSETGYFFKIENQGGTHAQPLPKKTHTQNGGFRKIMSMWLSFFFLQPPRRPGNLFSNSTWGDVCFLSCHTVSVPGTIPIYSRSLTRPAFGPPRKAARTETTILIVWILFGGGSSLSATQRAPLLREREGEGEAASFLCAFRFCPCFSVS